MERKKSPLLLICNSVQGIVKTSFNYMYLLFINFCGGPAGRKRSVCLNVVPQHSFYLFLDYSKKEIQGLSSFLTIEKGYFAFPLS